jgi:hypothetical protein
VQDAGLPPLDLLDIPEQNSESVATLRAICVSPFCKPDSAGDLDQKGFLGPHLWDNLDACELVDALPSLNVGDLLTYLQKEFGLIGVDGQPTKPESTGLLSPVQNAISWAVGAIPRWLLKLSVGQILKIASLGEPCLEPDGIAARAANAVASWIQSLTGFDLKAMICPNEYYYNHKCPYLLPDLQNAVQAWTRGEINDETLDCWATAHGFLLNPFHAIRDSNRARWTVNGILDLYRRKIIKDDELNARLRDIGHVRESDYAEARELAKLIPPYSDIIRMMVRDVDDDTIPDWPDSDKLFAAKYGKQLQRWGEAQGLPEQAAKYLWRAHWSIPAPGQLFNFYHRLRKLPDGDPNRVTLKEIEQALLQQDILPRWIPKFLAVSFRPMGRIDIRRSYAVGTTKADELPGLFQQLGYSDEVAESMTKFTRQQVRVSTLNTREIRQYQSGGLNYDDAYSKMVDRGVDGEDAEWSLNRAADDMRAASRTVCVRAVRRRYVTGELDRDDAAQALLGLGLDVGQSDIFLSAWDCEIGHRGKTATLAQLCQWLDAGLIDGAEMRQRLVRLGWDEDDATRHIIICERRINVRLEKEEKKRRREQAAAAERERREDERRKRDLDKRARDLASAADRRTKLTELRDAGMQRAAKILVAKCKIPVTTAGLLVRDAVQLLRKTQGRTIDEAIRAAVLAAESASVTGCESYLTTVEEFGVAEQAAEEVTVDENSNGNGKLSSTP